VARIDLTPSGLRVIEFTGTVKQLAGKIRSIDFIKSVAWIEAGKESLEGTQ
jgi:hypothetical protein